MGHVCGNVEEQLEGRDEAHGDQKGSVRIATYSDGSRLRRNSIGAKCMVDLNLLRTRLFAGLGIALGFGESGLEDPRSVNHRILEMLTACC